MRPRYIASQAPSTSSGSRPTSVERRLWATAWELSWRMSAATTSGAESTSPMPGDPLVGVHEDDEVVLAPVRDPVVDGRLSEDDRLDVGDLHAISSREARIGSAGLPGRLSTIAKLSTIH